MRRLKPLLVALVATAALAAGGAAIAAAATSTSTSSSSSGTSRAPRRVRAGPRHPRRGPDPARAGPGTRPQRPPLPRDVRRLIFGRHVIERPSGVRRPRTGRTRLTPGAAWTLPGRAGQLVEEANLARALVGSQLAGHVVDQLLRLGPEPARRVTHATTRSPRSSSGSPVTAASSTAGWSRSEVSISPAPIL